MDSETIVKAVLSTLDPNINNVDRTKCFKMIEEYKTTIFQLSDLPLLCGSGQHPSVILFGLKCLEHRIKHSWNQLTSDMKGTIKESIFQLSANLQTLIHAEAERKVISLVLTQIFVYLIKCEWPQRWPTMLDEFFTLGRKGPLQAKLTLNTFLRLYEDVVQFQDVPPSRRRDIASTLNDNLPQLFSFAFEILIEQLHAANSQACTPDDASSLCCEALAMLSGYLDSCRMDFISQWRPPGVSDLKYSAPELPFLRLVVNFVLIEGTRTPALDLLLILLKRKVQQSSEDTGSKLGSVLLSDAYSVTRLLTVLTSALNDAQGLSENGYNTLLLISEVIALLGVTMTARWTEFRTQSSPCECVTDMPFTCPNQFTHILSCILRIMNHPIRTVSATSNIFWLAALRSSEPSLIAHFSQFIPDLFLVWRRGIRKDGSKSAPGTHNHRLHGIFDSDEYSVFLSKYRVELVRCFNLAVSHWPAEFLQLITSFAIDVVKATSTTPISGESNMHDPYIADAISDWEALEVLFEQVLPSVKEGYVASGHADQFDQIMTDAMQRYLQTPPPQPPSLRGKYLVCSSAAFQHVNATHDSELLIPLLTQIFACFRYNPFETTSPDFGRPKCVKNMHLEAAASFFRLTRANPERIMPHFDAIGSEVTSLWADPCSGVMEKCVLLEALILLCLRLPQPIIVQRDLLKQIVTHVTSSWCPPTSESDAAPMARLLSACASGGLGLLSALGLNQPLSSHQDLQSPYVQLRIAFGQNTLALLAISRRLAEPVNSEQLSQITIPLLEPILPSVVVALRAFNQLWLPDIRARVDPSLISIFEMSDRTKTTVLSVQFGRSEKSQRDCDEPRTPLDRIRLSLYEHHENLMNIAGNLFTGLSPLLYALPTDQLALVLHQGCCVAFEHLPDVKLNNIIRLVIRPFIRSCPKMHLTTALVPLIPPIVEAVVQRLDASWHRFAVMSQATLIDNKSVAKELLEERITRLLSRTLIDLLRLIYTFNGSESGTPSSDSDADKLDDIDMTPDSELTSNTAPVNHTNDNHNHVGALAYALLASSSTDSQPGNSDEIHTCPDPVFLCSLAKCLSWPDSVTCAKASQWIPLLVDTMLQPSGATATTASCGKNHLPAALAESVLFGILCGLHVHGKNTDSNLPGLLLAGLRVYTSVDASVACDRLRAVITKVLLNATGEDSSQSAQVFQSIQNFENKLFNNARPLPEKAKREMFKKLIQPIIGVPLSRQFSDTVAITPLAPLARSKWRQPTRNGDSFPDTFGLCALFSH